MNKETFIGSLNKPDLLDQESIPELDSIIDEFPYFQTARILLALNLSKENHQRFEKELSSAAIHIADRRLLRDHIENLISAETPTIDLLQPQPMVLDPEIVEEELVEEEVEVQETVDKLAFEEEKTQDSPEVETPIIIEEAEESIEEAPAIEVVEEADQPELIEEEEQPGKAIEKVEQEKAVETVGDEEPQPISEDEVIEDEEDRIAKLKSIVEARLKSIEEERRQSAKAEQEVVEAPLTDESLPQETGIMEGQLIDEFIKHEPSISRAQATFFNPVDAAKESVVDEEDIVSETLAKIYFDQRKYGKAINIYQKLSLNNPEKSSYFARLIENALEELKR